MNKSGKQSLLLRSRAGEQLIKRIRRRGDATNWDWRRGPNRPAVAPARTIATAKAKPPPRSEARDEKKSQNQTLPRTERIRLPRVTAPPKKEQVRAAHQKES